MLVAVDSLKKNPKNSLNVICLVFLCRLVSPPGAADILEGSPCFNLKTVKMRETHRKAANPDVWMLKSNFVVLDLDYSEVILPVLIENVCLALKNMIKQETFLPLLSGNLDYTDIAIPPSKNRGLEKFPSGGDTVPRTVQ